MSKKTMRTKFILLFLAVGLVWTGSAVAINVPDANFDAVPVAGNGGVWDYVTNHDTPWFATGEAAGGSPWIGNNYSLSGYDYPGMGHSGAQWVDLNVDYIAQALESMLAQSYQQWELIIVDDCSTDRTKSIVEEFLDVLIWRKVDGWHHRFCVRCGEVPVPVLH